MGNSTANTSLRSLKGPQHTPRHTSSPAADQPTGFVKAAKIENERTEQGTSSKENISTPVKAFLSSNVTPRSSSRKARVDSASSTPNETPNGTPNATPGNSRPASMVNGNNDRVGGELHTINGLGMKGLITRCHGRSGSVASNGRSSIISHKEMSPERSLSGKDGSSLESSPMFFHASDIHAKHSAKPSSQQPLYHPKTPIAAHVGSLHTSKTNGLSNTNSTPTSATISEPKFFHANGIPVSMPSSSKSQGSVISPSSSATSPSQTRFSLQTRSVPQRPTSPLKDAETAKALPKKQASPRAHISLNTTVVNKLEHPHHAVASPVGSDLERRSSLKVSSKPIAGHVRAHSINSNTSPSNRRSSLIIPERKSIINPSSPSAIVAEPKSLLEDPSEGPNPPQTPDQLSLPQSPTKSTLTDKTHDLPNTSAANARRERKVLDLEISNSSLLAINRTLEREMRKQTAELRRYRRLTAAGRLSTATKRSVSSRISGATDGTNLTSDSDPDGPTPLDDFSDSEFEEAETSTAPTSPYSTSNPSTMMMPNSRPIHRLHLNLSSHRALLVESQQINQSMKRCLGSTESMIAEGRRALAYCVKVDDMVVPTGRVLDADEVDGEYVGKSKALLGLVHERRDLGRNVEDGETGVVEDGGRENGLRDLDPVVEELLRAMAPGVTPSLGVMG